MVFGCLVWSGAGRFGYCYRLGVRVLLVFFAGGF